MGYTTYTPHSPIQPPTPAPRCHVDLQRLVGSAAPAQAPETPRGIHRCRGSGSLTASEGAGGAAAGGVRWGRGGAGWR